MIIHFCKNFRARHTIYCKTLFSFPVGCCGLETKHFQRNAVLKKRHITLRVVFSEKKIKMPVYIRKNVNFTPPSIDNFPMEDDEDYITDPDQLLDRLPQPYRMIDKVLTQWYDDVWEIIEKRENARLEESRKIRPPQYECSTQMKVHTCTQLHIV